VKVDCGRGRVGVVGGHLVWMDGEDAYAS
jgi:hypothetical protein